MNMKALKYILIAALPFAFAACEEEIYTPGEPEMENCQGFYFPSQDNTMDHMLSPEDPTVLEFRAARKVEDGEISIVPEISVYANGEVVEDLIEPFEITFDDGQLETIFKVDFSRSETGVKYTFNIAVTDPQYVSIYGLEQTEIEFSVLRVAWEYIGKGVWRDDMMSSLFTLDNKFGETECEIYERKDLPGYYRVDGVYTAEYYSELIMNTPQYAADLKPYVFDTAILIDATDPNKVWFPEQYLGFYLPAAIFGTEYGYAIIASDVPEVFGNETNALYGKLQDGVMTFPKNALIFGLSNYGLFVTNSSAKFRLTFPGAKAYDYSVELAAGNLENGVLPINFYLGADVAEVRYAAFEGRLTDVDMVNKLEDVKTGKVSTTKQTTTGVVDFTAEKTSFYTIIGCIYNAAGEYQGYVSTNFGYATAEDPRELNITPGLIVSNKHAEDGYTTENSMEFYVYGEDITYAKLALFKKVHYTNVRENIENELINYVLPFTDAQLDSLNNDVYSGMIGGLSPGTEYILLVYAENGYHSQIFTAEAKTGGEYSPLDETYIVYDMPDANQAESKEEYFHDWEYWTFDIFDPDAYTREYVGQVTISENEEDLTYVDGGETVTVDYINISGLFPQTVKDLGISNDCHFEYYNGFLFSLMTEMPYIEMKDNNDKNVIAYPTNAYVYVMNGELGVYCENYAMVGGMVEDGVMAFIASPYASADYITMALCYFTSPDYSTGGYLFDETHSYPLLVAPDSPYAGKAAPQAAFEVPESCNQLSSVLQSARSNYVETESGYIKTAIDQLSRRAHNYLVDVKNVEVELESQVADYTVTESNAKVDSELRFIGTQLKRAE